MSAVDSDYIWLAGQNHKICKNFISLHFQTGLMQA